MYCNVSFGQISPKVLTDLSMQPLNQFFSLEMCAIHFALLTKYVQQNASKAYNIKYHLKYYFFCLELLWSSSIHKRLSVFPVTHIIYYMYNRQKNKPRLVCQYNLLCSKDSYVIYCFLCVFLFIYLKQHAFIIWLHWVYCRSLS